MKFWVFLLAALLASHGWAESVRVTTLRAAPGALSALVEAVRDYRQSRRGGVIVMRHSQGDHWDLMLLEPAAKQAAVAPDFSSLVDFSESLLADSAESFAALQRQAATAGLYHVEMFHALAGKREALVDQRRRENDYLAATGQVTNAVFVTTFGTDVDVFTVGFHESLASFAAPLPVTAERAERAAREAGFKSRADLGLYLRSLLTRHNDTLAVPIGE